MAGLLLAPLKDILPHAHTNHKPPSWAAFFSDPD